MTKADWLVCGDPDPMIRALRTEHHQRELRLFAAACVRRIWHLLPRGCRSAVKASERFADAQIDEWELAAAMAVAEREALAADRGGRAADAREFATSAAIDASSVWPRSASNVLAATTCAAKAVGCAVAESGDPLEWDTAFKPALRAELAAQADLLRRLVSFPGATTHRKR